MTDEVTIVESWMLPYWQSFVDSKHPAFGIWICQHITIDNINDIYKWYCKQYNHDHFVKYVPVIVDKDGLNVVNSFIKTLTIV